MSIRDSKRALYKPAPTENNVKREQRRALTQGRLVNSPVIPDTLTAFASPSSTKPISQNTYGDVPVVASSHDSLAGLMTPPRQTMASFSSSSTNNSSMRRPPTSMYMTSGVPQSPPKPSPSAALDLSDYEQEPVNLHTPVRHKMNGSNASMLAVDASGSRLDNDIAEVPVSTSTVRSPAKVICHVPDVVQSDLRNTGFTEAAARVQMDPVPTVMLHGDKDFTQPGTHGSPHPTKLSSPLVTRETKVEALYEDQIADDEESIASEVSDQKDSSLALKDNISQDNDASINVSKESVKSATGEERKKKKTTTRTHVASRYMQSATKRGTESATASQSKSAAKPSTKTSRKTTKPPSMMKKPPSNAVPSTSRKPSHISIAPSAAKPKKSSVRLSTFSYTPMARGVVGSGGVTSTPALDGSFFPSAGHIDASAISCVSNDSVFGADISVLSANPKAELASRFDETRISSHRDLSNPESSGEHDHHHKGFQPPKEPSQADLDAMYARYLQTLFIDSKMRKAAQSQEKDAMNQIHALFAENNEMHKRRTDMKMKLARLRHANQLLQQVEAQKSGLKPVTAHLDQFKQEYSTLAHALDTTRHQIATSGIHIPQNEEQYQDELLHSFDESEDILRAITSMIQEAAPKISEFAKASTALQEIKAEEEKEFNRCQGFLASASFKTVQETSFRLQELEKVEA